MAQQEPQATPTPAVAPAEPTTARTDQALFWALGGGALLLLGLGGAALVRRRRPDEKDAIAPTYEPALEPATVAVAPMPTMATPVAPRPAMASPRLAEDATLEAMVAAAPNAENPFRTRTKRMRRAQYLIAQREAASVTAPAPQTTHAEPTPVAAADRSQTVYRFGSQQASSGFLRPRPAK